MAKKLIPLSVCFGIASLPLWLIFGDLLNQINTVSYINEGDQRFNFLVLNWGLDWILNQVPQDTASLWDFYIYHPYRQALTLSSNHLGSLPLTAFFHLFTDDWFTKGNLWIHACYLLNAIAMFHVSYLYLKREWQLDLKTLLILAATLSLAFSYSPPRIHYLEHSQTLPSFATPYFFYFGYLTVKNSLKWMVPTALMLSWQVFLDIHISLMAMLLATIGLTIYLGGLLIKKERSAIIHLIQGSVGTALICALLIWPLLEPYLDTKSLFGIRDWGAYNMYRGKESFLTKPGPMLTLYGDGLGHVPGEGNNFPGMGFLGLFLLLIGLVFTDAVRRVTKKSTRWSCLAPLVWLVPTGIFVNYMVHKSAFAWLIWRTFPGFDSIRTPARFSILLPIIIAVCFFAYMKSRGFRGWKVIIPAGLCGLLTLAEASSTRMLTWHRIEKPQLAAALKMAEGPTIVLPFIFDPNHNLDIMQYARIAQKRVGNGYSGFLPASFLHLVDHAKDYPPKELTRQLLTTYRSAIVPSSEIGKYQPEGYPTTVVGHYTIVHGKFPTPPLKTSWRDHSQYFPYIKAQ